MAISKEQLESLVPQGNTLSRLVTKKLAYPQSISDIGTSSHERWWKPTYNTGRFKASVQRQGELLIVDLTHTPGKLQRLLPFGPGLEFALIGWQPIHKIGEDLPVEYSITTLPAPDSFETTQIIAGNITKAAYISLPRKPLSLKDICQNDLVRVINQSVLRTQKGSDAYNRWSRLMEWGHFPTETAEAVRLGLAGSKLV